MKRLLRLREVAQRLTCSLSNVYALIEAGVLPKHRVGLKKGFRVAEEDLLAYLNRVRENTTEGINPKTKTLSIKIPLKHLSL